MYPENKFILLILAVCIAFPVVFAEAVISVNLEHDCCNTTAADRECIPCLQIEASAGFLKALKMIGVYLFLAACLMFLFQVLIKYRGVVFYPLSPILLKVRFNT